MAMDYDPTKYETFRPNYELKQSLAWFCTSIAYLGVGTFYSPGGAADLCAIGCMGMGLWKFKPAVHQLGKILRLAGTPLPFVDFEKLKSMMNDPVHEKDMWLGRGVPWGPNETQAMTELMNREYAKTYRDSLGFLYLIRYLRKNLKFTLLHPFKSRHNYYEIQKRIAEQPGYTFIHGVGGEEEDLFQPIGHTEGHTLIIGTTGSGKTRCFDLLISQAVLRGETVFIIDPKGDKDLMEKAQRACEMLGRGDKFVSFHPAFPNESIKINLLANWSRPSEIADRIAALMPTTSDSDPFKSFAFGAMNSVCAGLCSIYKSPTLKTIKHYLSGTGSGAIAALVVDVLHNYIAKSIPNGESEVARVIQAIPANKRDAENVANKLVELYQAKPIHQAEMDDLINLFTHPHDHFGKMITSLLPVLSMLTNGALGDMLSPPDADAGALTSTWRDTASLIDSNCVVYVGLDSLSDPMVGSAIGSLFLSDLACVAGARYNYTGTDAMPKGQNQPAPDADRQQSAQQAESGEDVTKSPLQTIKDKAAGAVGAFLHKTSRKSAGAKKRTINLFVDEAAEVVNGPFLQLLNKGRGANFKLFVATQTYADFASRMGSRDKASQLLGNLNNRICLRCVDPDTQKFVASLMPKTYIKRVERSQALSTNANVQGPSGGNLGERLTSTEVPLFQPEWLGMLPNLEFIASLSGGHVIKGRYPLILKDASEYKS